MFRSAPFKKKVEKDKIDPAKLEELANMKYLE